MARSPAIPHKALVDFILSGHTTRDARSHFGFENENVANLRVYAAFKALAMRRPRYEVERICEFCSASFVARDRKQRSCGSERCQTALIVKWQGSNKDKVIRAQSEYRRSSKGRNNNLRMHARRRSRGISGTDIERWNYAVAEAGKRLRKLKNLHIRNRWEYRLEHIQKMSGLIRTFSPRRPRNVFGTHEEAWHLALRAVQTAISQATSRQRDSQWEAAVSRIGSAIRSGHRTRSWNKTKS